MNYEELETVMDKLSEHFDSVLLCVTVKEEGVTRGRVRRRGNYYASMGFAQSWLDGERNIELAQEIADKTKPD